MENALRFDHFQSMKSQHYGSCHDSGYMDQLHTPKLATRVKGCDPLKPFCLDGVLETPKENQSQTRESSLSFNSHNKDRSKESARGLENDPKKEPALQTGWCETPKFSKKDASLRRRLLMSKSASDSKTNGTKTPGGRGITSANARCGELCSRSNGDFDSPDMRLMEALATSTLKAEDMALSCRKRRLMFSQMITSTREDGKSNIASPPLFQNRAVESLVDTDLDESIISGLPSPLVAETPETPETPQCNEFTPSAKENFQTPVNNVAANLSESLSVLSMPSFTPTPKLDASTSEDSGFTSLGLDKSQDSSLDYDGSFQELLLPSASRSRDTPRLAEMKRRSGLERQRRLSTLREGGSQSEEEGRATAGVSRRVYSVLEGPSALLSREDDIFVEGTPLRTAREKLEDLSLTPALQMVHVMSQRSARMLPEQTSLEELLRLIEEDGPIKTSMPLAGLIGKKMGLGKLDILAELKMKNLMHILALILNQLSPDDICKFGQVSIVWDEIVQQDLKACRRRRSYLKARKIALELGSAAHVPDAETRLSLSSRPVLRLVQAQSNTPGTRTPSRNGTLTPIRQVLHLSSKREEFLEVAKTLFSDECLRPCPRCQHPARCHSVKREGVCSRDDCVFQFCTSCLCAFHGSKECPHLSGKRRNKRDVLPGSAQSKRNVRRL